jgi:hypothetical protein
LTAANLLKVALPWSRRGHAAQPLSWSAVLHVMWDTLYANESLEAVEFDEGHSNMKDLIKEYEMHSSASVDETGTGEEDEAGGHIS